MKLCVQAPTFSNEGQLNLYVFVPRGRDPLRNDVKRFDPQSRLRSLSFYSWGNKTWAVLFVHVWS